MNSFKIILKGFFMGMAEIIPGISGGTIALILGIYERLITALSKIDYYFLRRLFKGHIKEIWNYIDGIFLLQLTMGMILGILSLSSVIIFLLENFPIFLKALLSALLLGSLMIRPLRPRGLNKKILMGFIGSLFIAILLFNMPVPNLNDINLFYIFFGGFLAICAFILPGLSGSFILLLLGIYPFMVHSLNSLDIFILSIFISGCLFGLLTFVKILKSFYDSRKTVLEGFFFGLVLFSIPMIWKEQGFSYLILKITYLTEFTMGSLFGFFLIFLINKTKNN
jgi:putative membrane protein